MHHITSVRAEFQPEAAWQMFDCSQCRDIWSLKRLSGCIQHLCQEYIQEQSYQTHRNQRWHYCKTAVSPHSPRCISSYFTRRIIYHVKQLTTWLQLWASCIDTLSQGSNGGQTGQSVVSTIPWLTSIFYVHTSQHDPGHYERPPNTVKLCHV